ncbi:MAG: hypothetical protein HY344_00485 [Candidatus Levybacteria bacterium]|nr:hypothetical protein [Candidatus Levybacteria bacterium]
MDNLTFTKIKEAIEKYNNIAIAVPSNPLMDEMAAALSLYLSISTLGKSVSIASPTTPLVEVSNLVGIDRVQNTLGGGTGDLVVSFPYREGEIEKVSYTRDDNFLNIVVKAGELGLNFDEKAVRFTRGGASPELLFVIGAERVTDLGALYDVNNLKDTVLVNIDNKAGNQGYGDIVMVSNKLSSISEAVANLLISLNYKIDIDAAENLLDGITAATNNFQNPNTSSLAFEMVGILMRTGAQRATQQTLDPRQAPRQDNFIKQTERQIKTEQIERKENVISQQSPISQGAPINQTPPPDDWLEPKIYKGSTNF